MEITKGLQQFRSSLANAGIEIIKEQHNFDGSYTYFDLGNKRTSLDLTIPDEFFADLPGSKQHQEELQDWVSWLKKRIGNHDAKAFVTKGGLAISLGLEWPLKPHPLGKTLKGCLSLLPERDQVAQIYIMIDDFALDTLEHRPFLKHKALFTAARQALDKHNDTLNFYPKSQHPIQRQEVRYEENFKPAKSGDDQIGAFILQKVYSLGFKLSDQDAEVWVNDPWDAEYLGIEVNKLKQSAQLLRAAGFIMFPSASEFATAGDSLILRMSQPPSERKPIGFVPG